MMKKLNNNGVENTPYQDRKWQNHFNSTKICTKICILLYLNYQYDTIKSTRKGNTYDWI